jgi:hypothetical protein
MELESFKKAREEDYVEAEIVSGPGASASSEGGRAGNRREKVENYGTPRPEPGNIPFYGLFLRLKFIFITATLLIGFGLMILGIILTSTVIGAIVGIPLLLLGGFLIWLLFKLLTLGQRSRPIILRRM